MAFCPGCLGGFIFNIVGRAVSVFLLSDYLNPPRNYFFVAWLEVVLLTNTFSSPDHSGIVSKTYRGDSFLLKAAWNGRGMTVTEDENLPWVSWRDFIFKGVREG